eukprot:2351091-Prymnesium_polylepis.1
MHPHRQPKRTARGGLAAPWLVCRVCPRAAAMQHALRAGGARARRPAPPSSDTRQGTRTGHARAHVALRR